AFWLNESTSANPDHEILAAVRPSLLTTRGPLIQISTGYAKRGELYRVYEKYFGKDDPSTLVVQGGLRDFNPTISEEEVARPYEADPESAKSEIGGLFRDDISAFIDRDTVMACVNRGVREIGPRGHSYHAYIDPSGGRVDSMCLAISHQEDERIV